MGGTNSKSSVESLQETVTNIAYSIAQSCASSSDQNQEVTSSQLSLFGINNASVTQTTDIDFTCATKSNKQTDLQNQIVSAISNSSDSNGIALFSAFGRTKAEATVNIRNIVTTNLTMSNIQQTYIIIKNSQTGFFSQTAIFGSNYVDVTQGASIFARAVNEILETSGIYQTIESHIENSASATEKNPLQFLADIFTGAATTAMYIVIGIILIIIALGLGIVFAGKSIDGGLDPDSDGQLSNLTEPTDNIDSSEIDPDLVYEDFSS